VAVTREEVGRIPFWLVLHVHLPLSVVANVADLGETANIELCRAKLRHDGGTVGAMGRPQNVDEHAMRFAMAGAGGQMRQAEPCGSLAGQSSSITPQPQSGPPSITHKNVKSRSSLAQVAFLGRSKRVLDQLECAHIFIFSTALPR
jgi:hypothetical protein